MADARDRRDQTGIAYSTDLVTWHEALDHPVLPRREGRFDSRVVEPGPPPVLTDEGILLLYNAADDNLVYRTGWALFDRRDPTRLLARSERPLFEPIEPWEKTGQVRNVMFVEGLVIERARWLVYIRGRGQTCGRRVHRARIAVTLSARAPIPSTLRMPRQARSAVRTAWSRRARARRRWPSAALPETTRWRAPAPSSSARCACAADRSPRP